MARTSPHRRAKGDIGARARPQPREDLLSTAQAVTEQTRRLRAQTAALAEARRAIEEANQRFADLYDFVPIPYLIVSNLGIIRHVNAAALQMLGGEREWIVGRPLIGYIDSCDMRKVLDSVLSSSTGFSQSLEVRMRARDGVRVVQMLTRRRRLDEHSAPTFHISLVDLTEMRHLEQERAHAEQERRKSEEAERMARAHSEAKDEFLAMLSHELRTPLTPILAAADALMAHASLSPELLARLDIIRRNVRAEARLIDDLLDVARINKNKLEVSRRPLDLHRLLGETVEAWSAPLAQHRLALDVALDAPAHWVDGDHGRLGQVFRNLIANAVKFSEPGGHISVRTEQRDGQLRVTIADTGAGMSDRQLKTLFTPFVQSKDISPRHGLGLGLVISQAIVEAHEGTLGVRSAGPGRGTMVTVELPTVPAPWTRRVPGCLPPPPRLPSAEPKGATSRGRPEPGRGPREASSPARVRAVPSTRRCSARPRADRTG